MAEPQGFRPSSFTRSHASFFIAPATPAPVLGDPAGGSPGFRAQSFVEEAFGFRLGIDRDGQGDWAGVIESIAAMPPRTWMPCSPVIRK